MAQSPTERVTTLERRVDVLTTQLGALKDQVVVVRDLHAESAKELALLKREVDRELALLKRDVEDLKKGREEWGRRLWMILPPVLAVLISTALTLLITLYFKK